MCKLQVLLLKTESEMSEFVYVQNNYVIEWEQFTELWFFFWLFEAF